MSREVLLKVNNPVKATLRAPHPTGLLARSVHASARWARKIECSRKPLTLAIATAASCTTKRSPLIAGEVAFPPFCRLLQRASHSSSQPMKSTFSFHVASLTGECSIASVFAKNILSPSALFVTVDPLATEAFKTGGGFTITNDAVLSKGFVTSGRGRRKMAKGPQECFVRQIELLDGLKCTWLGVPEEWDMCDMSLLPFVRKQAYDALQMLFVGQQDVVFVTSSSSQSRTRAVVFLLLLICCSMDLPLAEDLGGKLVAGVPAFITATTSPHVDSIAIRLELWRGGEALKGRALDERIEELLCVIQSACGMNVSDAALLFARRMAASVIKDRIQSRGMARVVADLHVQVNRAMEDARTAGNFRRCKDLPPNNDKGLAVCEFFSGIGGMRLGLPSRIAGYAVDCVRAFDQASVPNAVYRHNFESGRLPKPLDEVQSSVLKDTVVQGLTVASLDEQADIWTLSPPCQPFTTTRGAHHRDHLDHRSRGLCHMIQLLLHMRRPPRWIFLENVKGFVGSHMHELWRSCLTACGFEFEEFVLSPDSTVGLPNSRARYYCLATHRDEALRRGGCLHSVNDLLKVKGSTCEVLNGLLVDMADEERRDDLGIGEEDAENFDENNSLAIHGCDERVRFCLSDAERVSVQDILTLESVLSASPAVQVPSSDVSQLLLSSHILSQSWARAHISVATPADRSTFCFTKGYGRLVDRAAGSCFLPEGINNSSGDTLVALEGRLRLFHPRELLRLFGFPENFSFPEQYTMRQQFSCIGNSVNVRVVQRAMMHLFKCTADDGK